MELFDGVRLVKDPAAPEDAPDRSSARSADGDGGIAGGSDPPVVDKVVDFFKSRSIQFRLFDDESRQMTDGKSPFLSARRNRWSRVVNRYETAIDHRIDSYKLTVER